MRRRRWRNRWTFAAGALLWPFVGAGMFLSGGQKANGPMDYAAAGSVLFVLCYLASLMSMFSWVRLTPSALIVQNPGSRLVIPWAKVRGVGCEHGLHVEVEGRAEPVHSMAYQGSLLGRWAGWPSSRKAAEAIEKYRRGAAVDGGDGEVRQSFPWRAHLLWLGIGWPAVAVVMPLLGRYAA